MPWIKRFCAPTNAPTNAPTHAPPRTTKRQAVALTLLGNFLETFDFAVYSYFAVTISLLFFPTHTASTALLLSLSIYGSGLLLRPMGALVFGLYADRQGRRTALTLSLGLMGLGTLIIACAPTHAQIGVSSSVILLIGRLLQGFSQGGERGTAITALIEIDRVKGRGLRSALETASSASAGVLGAAVVLTLTHVLSPEDIINGGWRIPFFLGATVVPAGVLLRYKMPDDRPVPNTVTLRQTAQTLKPHAKTIAWCCWMFYGQVVGFTLAGHYLPVHAMHWLKLDLKDIHWIGLIGSLIVAIFSPLFGALSDFLSRRKSLVLCGYLILILTFVPAYWTVNHYRSLSACILVAAILKCFLSLTTAPLAAWVSELFPGEIRATATSICYAIPACVFASVTHVVCLALTTWSGSLLAPACYVTACMAISVFALSQLPETGHTRLR